jgi:hypothetical protein
MPQVHSMPVMVTQDAPRPNASTHAAVLGQPQEAGATVPHRVGPNGPSSGFGWKHWPPMPHVAGALQASAPAGQELGAQRYPMHSPEPQSASARHAALSGANPRQDPSASLHVPVQQSEPIVHVPATALQGGGGLQLPFRQRPVPPLQSASLARPSQGPGVAAIHLPP